MWLINVSTLKLEYIVELDPTTHRYAILSHCWGTDEVSFAEMTASQSGADTVSEKAGYQKIKRCCERARRDGLGHAWVDTCCIDKTSSAELGESINSMFKWYQQARVCYVLLDDVPDSEGDIRRSRWFTRGWTLQELIAPPNVEFYSTSWNKLGTKSGLCDLLSEVTNIDKDVLLGNVDLCTIPVARRMSWAAHRQTTRTEDAAYCLLGIFDINMAMLYGEGHKAFIRLQEEILKTSDDHTLFAWVDPTAADEEERGLLAPHPRCFKNSGHWVPNTKLLNKNALKVTVSNRGLSLLAMLKRDLLPSEPGEFRAERQAVLFCTAEQGKVSPKIALNVPNGNYTARVRASWLGKYKNLLTEGSDVFSQPRASEVCISQHPERYKSANKIPKKWLEVRLGVFRHLAPLQREITQVWVSPETHMASEDDLAHIAPTSLHGGRWISCSDIRPLGHYRFSLTKPVTTLIILTVRLNVPGEHGLPSLAYIHIGVNGEGKICTGIFEDPVAQSDVSHPEEMAVLDMSKEVHSDLRYNGDKRLRLHLAPLNVWRIKNITHIQLHLSLPDREEA